MTHGTCHVSVINISFKRNDGSCVTSPCLVIDGRVSPAATAWLVEKACEGGGHGRGSSLERYASALKKFVQFYHIYGEGVEITEVVRRFAAALDSGDPNLGWRSLGSSSTENVFEAFNQFCDWMAKQPAFESFEHPNPKEVRPMNAFEQISDDARRQQTDLFYHLRKLSKGRGQIAQIRRFTNRNRFKKPSYSGGRYDKSGLVKPNRPNPRGMPFADYVKLLKSERNPRNLLLWLALGAGACRVSEALQLFSTDIFYSDSKAEALVALANPVRGLVFGSKENGYIEREKYLMERYRVPPRCNLPKSNPLHAGWKGMITQTFVYANDSILDEWTVRRWTQMYFLLPIFGRLFWKAHLTYSRQRLSVNPRNPYYFINFTRNRGNPMTRSNVTQVLEVSCRRAGIKPVRPHRLRHMYGNSLAAWSIPIATAQILMRHASSTSTQVYYGISEEQTRRQLERVQAEKEVGQALEKGLVWEENTTAK